MKKLAAFILLLTAMLCNAQNTKERFFVGAGYTYFNQRFWELGVRYLPSDDGYFLLGANVLLGKKAVVIPEISATQYFAGNASDTRSPFVRLSVSPKTITPQIGIGALIAEFSVGYGFCKRFSVLQNSGISGKFQHQYSIRV